MEDQIGIFCLGALVGIVIGIKIARHYTIPKHELIKRGLMHYNPTNGAIEWTEDK